MFPASPFAIAVVFAACLGAEDNPFAKAPAPPNEIPPGGANAPAPSPRWPLAISTSDLVVGPNFSVRVPMAATWSPPASATSAYAIPAPIVAVRGVDGSWRGHGYLETLGRIKTFTAKKEDSGSDWTLSLDYHFDGGERYQALLIAHKGVLTLTEDAAMGLRDLWVFDTYYDWQPTAGLVQDWSGVVAGLYLPCHYDQPAVALDTKTKLSGPKGLGIFSPREKDRDLLLVGSVPINLRQDLGSIQIWQRRQLAGDPASRHFLGSDTKSDGTPNPHTARMLGVSPYEGHVTLEFQLGKGFRHIAFQLIDRGTDLATLPQKLKDIANGTP